MSETTDVLIIGAGLSGLSIGSFLKQKDPNCSIKIIEQSDRPGGVIRTHMESGFLSEWGAHGFLDNATSSKKLLDMCQLDNEIQKAPLSEFVRYICLNKKLNLIPQNPKKIIMADLVSWKSKFRVMGDLFKPALHGEPTVSEWVEHRFGKALVPFADAVFTGTYAGDINTLSIDAVMPGIRQVETQYGSVIKGLIKKRKNNKKEKGVQKLTLPAMTSFVNGMETFPKALANNLKDSICYKEAAQKITKTDEGWQIETTNHTFRCKHLAIATSVNSALKLSQGFSSTTPKLLPEAKVATVALGFDQSAKIPFGFGYLAPREEKRFALGTLFSTHMFPGRAPKNCQQVEAIIGGTRNPEYVDLEDDVMVKKVMEDIGQLMELPQPIYSKVVRSPKGIPQLVQGYGDILQWRNELTKSFNQISYAGFGWNGIGINDMTKEAERVADEIIAGAKNQRTDSIKGVYF